MSAETPLMNTAEAAKYLRLSVSLLRKFRTNTELNPNLGRGPRAVTLGRRTFYKQADLDAWIALNTKA